jgi:hypothetical protein
MKERHGLVTAVLVEVFTMPLRHVVVFLLATVLLILIDVEVIEGWKLVHLFELLGLMLLLYMGSAMWRVAHVLKKQRKP